MAPWIPLVGGLASKLFDIIDKAIPDKSKAMELKHEIHLELLQFQNQLLQAQRDIIVAEATGHSWLQRNWRPLLMLVFTFIIAWNYAIFPIISIFAPRLKQLPIPPEMWALLKISISGYIISRSGEKIVTIVKNKDNSKMNSKKNNKFTKIVKETLFEDDDVIM